MPIGQQSILLAAQSDFPNPGDRASQVVSTEGAQEGRRCSV